MRETGRRPVRRAFHEDDGGFTTVGMVLALLVSLALLFSAAKVYKINSVAADVQNVADAAALAAENQVASFYIAAQVCDAVVLSLSLTSAVTAGAGAVALCIPGGQTVASRLLDASADIARARQRFAEEAADRLNALQNLLPYFAALQASQVARANDDGVARYFGIAFLAPEAGASIDFGSIDEATQAIDDLRARQDQVAQAAERADAASKEAQESKERAWRADCGNAPGYSCTSAPASLRAFRVRATPASRARTLGRFRWRSNGRGPITQSARPMSNRRAIRSTSRPIRPCARGSTPMPCAS